MKDSDLIERINKLLEIGNDGFTTKQASELASATASLLGTVYGVESNQLLNFNKEIEKAREKLPQPSWGKPIIAISKGHLMNLKSEMEMNLIGSLQKIFSGEVLTDFLKLSRATLNEKGDDAKNVASVLAAALFEDTIRRIATLNGIPHEEKLANVITELKKANLLKDSQVGIALSYLNFRNNSLHADWSKVDRPEVQSVLAFTEGLLLKHFS